MRLHTLSTVSWVIFLECFLWDFGIGGSDGLFCMFAKLQRVYYPSPTLTGIARVCEPYIISSVTVCIIPYVHIRQINWEYNTLVEKMKCVMKRA